MPIFANATRASVVVNLTEQILLRVASHQSHVGTVRQAEPASPEWASSLVTEIAPLRCSGSSATIAVLFANAKVYHVFW